MSRVSHFFISFIIVSSFSVVGKGDCGRNRPTIFSYSSFGFTHSNELQVPLLSFSATDPTLTPLQYPFFVRTTQSDLFQMAVVADIVDYYGWRDVISVCVDDDHGRNTVAALRGKLAEKRCKLSYKAPLSPIANHDNQYTCYCGFNGVSGYCSSSL
ncbi:hypothetical protein Patl1_29289 [Pistacia atlantica]|uniref:Uncharacterized protein n=1 Tax=Pistacia atlantica TaxID=434234 RepID=A0ACC1BDF6_9ROSI|nr:hypothetical protein Patl1_29289 [Pistacia atlantica]